jgi:hypothetical protein
MLDVLFIGFCDACTSWLLLLEVELSKDNLEWKLDKFEHYLRQV